MKREEQVHLGQTGMASPGAHQDGQTPICRLLLVQLLFGITYGGNCPFFRNHRTKKYLLMSYDSAVIVCFIACDYYAFSNDVFNRKFSQSPHKGIMYMLFKFSAFSMAIEFLSFKFLILKNGWTTIHTIKSLGLMNISDSQFRRIIGYLVVMALIYATLFPINFSRSDSFADIVIKDRSRSLFFCFMGIFYSMNKSSIGSILLFMGLALRQIIGGWTENLKSGGMRMRQLCQSVVELRQGVEDINAHIGLILFVKVFVNAMIVPSVLCSIFVGRLPPIGVLGVSGFAIACLIDICVICYSSQIMINAMADLCRQVEQMLALDSLDDCTHKQLHLILSMKNNIRLNVLGLFDLKTMTVLVIIGNIANYAVILIETTVPDIK